VKEIREKGKREKKIEPQPSSYFFDLKGIVSMTGKRLREKGGEKEGGGEKKGKGDMK